MKSNVDRTVKLGLLGALAIALTLLVRIPAPPPVAFLEYDMGDVPMLFATYAYGPLWGALLAVIVAVIQGVTVSASSGAIGILMHILSSCAGIIPAGIYYRSHKTRKGAYISFIFYILSTMLVMVACNYFLSPLYFIGPELSYKAAQGIVMSLIWYIIAFNLVKPVINVIITGFLYKPVSITLLKPKDASITDSTPNRFNVASLVTSACVLATGLFFDFSLVESFPELKDFRVWVMIALLVIELFAVLLSLQTLFGKDKNRTRRDYAIIALIFAMVVSMVVIATFFIVFLS